MPVHPAIEAAAHITPVYGCMGCHDPGNLNRLRLFTGEKVDLTSSSLLCGQCHSSAYKTWRAGLHTRTLGRWDGPTQYTPCTACHNPHRPGIETVRPEPAPTPPEDTLLRVQ